MSEETDFFNRLGAHTEGNSADELPAGATHNTYGLYVKDPADLVGLVAYSLYKRHKIRFLDSEHARTGKRATSEKIDTFCATHGDQSLVNLQRAQASKLLAGMNQALLAELVTDLNKEYDRKLIAELKQGNRFWKSIGYGVAGNLATAFFVAFVLIGASATTDDLMVKIKNMLFTPSSQSGTTAGPKP